MTEEDNVKVELEMPKDHVFVHGQNAENPAPESDSRAIKELKKTNRELIKTKKEVEELKEKVEKSEDEGPSIRKSIAKELDPEQDGPIKETTGYELGDIVTAPLHAPEPEVKGRPKITQVRNIMIGFALMPLALVCWPIFGGSVALAVAIVGAFFVAVGVFFRV